jgi:hypothetical protein
MQAMKHVQHTAPATGSDPALSHGSRSRSAVKLACAVAFSVIGLVVAGCGSSSKAPSAPADSVAAATAQPATNTTHSRGPGTGHAAAVRQVRQVRQPKTRKRHAPPRAPKANERYAPPRITKGNPVQHPIAGTGGNTANDDNPAGKASRADSGGRPTISGEPNPCVLVSEAQARAFTGEAVTVKEAPLGPTCIYQSSGSKTPVTTAVERVDFSVLKPHIKKLSKLTIGGRPVYCGVYGTAVTYVLLTGNRVLSISSPCALGT